MASLTASTMAVRPCTQRVRGTALRAAQNGNRTVMAADRAIWLPGGDFPKRECQRLQSRFLGSQLTDSLSSPKLHCGHQPPAKIFPRGAAELQTWRTPSSRATLASVGGAD